MIYSCHQYIQKFGNLNLRHEYSVGGIGGGEGSHSNKIRTNHVNKVKQS